ncbi:bifunctional DNA-formamidopyrimidine glycosylase/DNA-(apurinic or apyrimidinic site) lyase [Kangiella sediminilitoris]|uniref:Formamidopyrimidine-DNA glycosylase n=1 Tax=Kangiella sediminilitoris TaxID=1144748 RepID=A0A1B3B8M8_9GAMM|nr:bifunctional DNA-formamidopyrimidine glycosylase/DNA-(apurinic or apyrimidinic site) lyase [Kangiella sediminilitoris]AOE49106.1 Formamidopyrimidine-DNA glycosylase [Kangiella sediminilitoris]
MPELPEVETTTRGLSPHICGQKILQVNIYQPQLRWPVPEVLQQLEGQVSHDIERRAKYMLWRFAKGTVVMHLGMSGAMRVVDADTPLRKHDHFEVVFDNGKALRLNDPRRFGAILWQPKGQSLEIIDSLGPEPLSEEFNGKYLHQKLSKRKGAIKNAIMTNAVVVGVGNIYASESLFLSGIHPKRAANRISLKRCRLLAFNIKEVLAKAIKQGGTTLKDFTQTDGSPGYFSQELNVYGREGQACNKCQTPIKNIVLGQRSSFYCPRCQR